MPLRPPVGYPRFNGGPGNCPAKRATPGARASTATVSAASMEGRAIARPNAWSFELQWRAGQLPGQTSPKASRRADRSESAAASMEGRAIARPNAWDDSDPDAANCRFNGGPGNCPAKRQAVASPDPGDWPTGFNGGPGNCPAKRRRAGTMVASMEGRAIARPNPDHGVAPRVIDAASMEGRAIARPNAAASKSTPAVPVLQWRAGQLPGQTAPACPGGAEVQ